MGPPSRHRCRVEPGLVLNDLRSLSIDVDASISDVIKPDVVLVGGGPGQAGQMSDGKLHEWLRAVDQTTAWTTSACTGSLILAAAGVLRGRRATSHWSALEHLAEFGVTPAKERVVIDGHYATAAGVSAGIDMALTVAGRMQATSRRRPCSSYWNTHRSHPTTRAPCSRHRRRSSTTRWRDYRHRLPLVSAASNAELDAGCVDALSTRGIS